MKLGDFFSNPASARPVNPKPISFVVISKDKTFLPGGAQNGTKRQVRATINACLEFVGVDGETQSRVDARVRLRPVDPKAEQPDDTEIDIETQYQTLARAIREYDEREKTAGEPLFEGGAKQMRELVDLKECNRLVRAYAAYVAEEHPEVVDTATFRGPQTPGA